MANNTSMTIIKEGKRQKPIAIFNINDSYIIGVYQGNISKLDILIKYRQKENGKWSHRRTPKHIHWAVDLIIKMNYDKVETKRFLDFLLSLWDKITSDESEEIRLKNLEEETLLKVIDKESKNYQKLNAYGV